MEEDKHLVINEQGKVIERDITIPSGEIIHVVAGEGQYIVDNGAIKDIETGHFVKGPPKGGTHALTKEWNSQRINEMYQDKAASIVRKGIASVSELKSGSKSWGGGVLAISEKMAEMAVDGGRDGIEAAKFLFNAAGLLKDRRSGQNTPSDGVTIALGADIASQIIAIMAEKQQKE
jgi:hypothetical protein